MNTIQDIVDVIDPRKGHISINHNLSIGSGYDEIVHRADIAEPDSVLYADERAAWRAAQFTKEQKIRLADEMIKRWTAYQIAAEYLPTP